MLYLASKRPSQRLVLKRQLRSQKLASRKRLQWQLLAVFSRHQAVEIVHKHLVQ
jgi:hypothetical protein